MSETWNHPSTYIKAIWAGVTAFLGSLLVALLTLQSAGVEPVNPGQLGWIEWLTITLVTLGAFGGVFGLKNAEVPQRLSNGQEMWRELKPEAGDEGDGA